MNLWFSYDNGMMRPQPLSLLCRPQRFPRFHRRTTESNTQSAQRWRTQYLTLSKAQHEFILALVCYAIADAKGIPSLRVALEEYAENLVPSCVQKFNFFLAEPKEATVYYQLLGSSRIHQLTVSTLSPSQYYD